MDNMWATTISCIGSIIAALIGAIGSIMAARVGKEKPPERIVQNQVARKPVITSNHPQESQSVNTSELSQATTARALQKNKAGVLLGYTSVLGGITLSCSSVFFIRFPMMFSVPIIFSVLAIILGIAAIVTGKKWAGIIGLVLNGLAIMPFIVYFLILVIDSGVLGFG